MRRGKWAGRGGEERLDPPSRRTDSGSSTVEFAILFPIIVVLLFVGPQLAVWYTAKLAAEKAAAAAAR